MKRRERNVNAHIVLRNANWIWPLCGSVISSILLWLLKTHTCLGHTTCVYILWKTMPDTTDHLYEKTSRTDSRQSLLLQGGNDILESDKRRTHFSSLQARWNDKPEPGSVTLNKLLSKYFKKKHWGGKYTNLGFWASIRIDRLLLQRQKQKEEYYSPEISSGMETHTSMNKWICLHLNYAINLLRPILPPLTDSGFQWSQARGVFCFACNQSLSSGDAAVDWAWGLLHANDRLHQQAMASPHIQFRH